VTNASGLAAKRYFHSRGMSSATCDDYVPGTRLSAVGGGAQSTGTKQLRCFMDWQTASWQLESCPAPCRCPGSATLPVDVSITPTCQALGRSRLGQTPAWGAQPLQSG